MKKLNIQIEYDGGYPNLCSGKLIITINKKRWEFPSYCLSSGGSVWFDDEWLEHVEQGKWTIAEWPKNFPEKFKEIVNRTINEQIPHGCCGGCV